MRERIEFVFIYENLRRGEGRGGIVGRGVLFSKKKKKMLFKKMVCLQNNV